MKKKKEPKISKTKKLDAYIEGAGIVEQRNIVDTLEERGIVGPSEGAKPRKVIMTPQELTEWKLQVASRGSKVE